LKSEKGYEFLGKALVFEKMALSLDVEAVNGLASDPISRKLIRCTVIGFFAKVATAFPEKLKDLQASTGFLTKLGNLCHADDLAQEEREALLITIGNIGSAKDGLQLLQEFHTLDSRQTQADLLAYLIYSIKSGSGASKIIALQSLSCIFDRASSDANESLFCETLFHELQDFTHLLSAAKNAFDDSRVAAYAVMKGVFRFSWGLLALKDSGDAVSFILNRETENAKIGKVCNAESVLYKEEYETV
jgi:hypothetical protein